MGNQNPAPKHTTPTATTLLALLALLALTLLTGCGNTTNTTTTTTQADTPPTTTPATTTPTTPTNTTTTTTTTTTPTTPTTPTNKTERVPPTGVVEILSSAINPSGEIPAHYTCDGQDTPPPLEIKGVPPHTAELMIAVMQTRDVGGKIQFVWAATHIPPTTHTIINGKLPPGAVTATNSNGETKYHLCPPKGTQETYVTAIWALPHKLPAAQGFDPRALRHLAEQRATYQNFLFFHYTHH